MEEVVNHEKLSDFIKPYAHNRDIQKIICSYVKKNKGEKIIKYKMEMDIENF